MQMTRTKKVVLCALFTALIAVGAFIKVPIPVVPFTLQFLFTMLAGFLLGGKLGCLSVLIYLAMGLVGLPIFAEGGGFAYVLKPTFGYLIGFAVATFVTGVIANKSGTPSYKRLFCASFVGLFIVYSFGMVYYYLISNFYLNETIGIWPLFLYCFLLAVPGDIVLCILGAILSKRLMSLIESLYENIINGGQITKEEALELYNQPLEELCATANKIRSHFCSNTFDICTIINAKSGSCSENCKFCSQSSFNCTSTTKYPLLSAEKIVEQAKINHEKGVLRYSIVTSGKSLSDREAELMADTIKQICSEVGISVCASFGLLNKEQFQILKNAGITRIHNNLETSRNFFKNICSTHTYDEKIQAIKSAQSVGLKVCSGGIMGLGESVEDRIDMAIELRNLEIKSVPINMLNPIPGTPFENNEKLTINDMRRIVAVFRFILPDASIRLAGGRGLLDDKGESCFKSGANAVISGDMLTTSGITIKTDLELINKLGYQKGLCNE